MRFGRVDHIGEISNDLLQRWVTVDGIFPDLEGIRAQIHFRVRVAIENTSFLREQITDGLIVAVVLKKGFVCANHLGIFLQPLPHAGTQADNAFDPIGRQKRVAQDGLGLLADAVHTASPLHQANDGPGQVIVHHDRCILQVLAFAQYVGSYEDVEFLIGHNPRALVVAHRTEAPGKLCRVIRVASHSSEAAYPTSLQLCGKIVHCVGKLGKNKKFLAPMLVSDEAEERLELGITVGVPGTALLQHQPAARRYRRGGPWRVAVGSGRHGASESAS